MADHHQSQTQKDDPFLLNYSAKELGIASELLSNWLPFLSRGLCNRCTQTISERIRSLGVDEANGVETLKQKENFVVSTLMNMNIKGGDERRDNCDTHSLGSWKDEADVNDNADTNSSGSCKGGEDGSAGPVAEMEFVASTSETIGSSPAPFEAPRVKMSWADMAQEDEFEGEEEYEVPSRQVDGGNDIAEGDITVQEVKPKMKLSRDQREYIRFTSVKRKKDFICLERVNGKIVNILDGLELHTGVFSGAEQKRIVDYVEQLQERGENGELKGRTFSAPQKWMRGKGRVTIQFGCCYNYATDRNGNPPGILKNEAVEPVPHLMKVMIKRLIRWHVLPPSCVPDSCIINVYEVGDCIPPHIDNHDFVRPFCTVSLLAQCNIVFGSKLKVIGAGEFSGAFAIPLPVGSVLVLSGNGADVAKHCVPGVPSKRISITFRKMDESKCPIGYVREPDLQGQEPLPFQLDGPRRMNSPKFRGSGRRQFVGRDDREENLADRKGSSQGGSEPRQPNRSRQWAMNRQRVM